MTWKAKLLPDGRPPTEEDLNKAAHFSPIVGSCLEMARQGDLTREEALIASILALVDLTDRLFAQVAEMSFKQRTVYIER